MILAIFGAFALILFWTLGLIFHQGGVNPLWWVIMLLGVGATLADPIFLKEVISFTVRIPWIGGVP